MKLKEPKRSLLRRTLAAALGVVMAAAFAMALALTPFAGGTVTAYAANGLTISNPDWQTSTTYKVTATVPSSGVGTYNISVDAGSFKLTSTSGFSNGINGTSTATINMYNSYTSVQLAASDAATAKAAIESIVFTYPGSGTQNITVSAAPTLESGDILYNGHIYQLSSSKATWKSAMESSLSASGRYSDYTGSYLKIDSAGENNVLMNFFSTTGSTVGIWIAAVPVDTTSGSITVSGTTVTITGTPTSNYSSYTSDPNNSGKAFYWLGTTENLPAGAAYWRGVAINNGGPVWFGYLGPYWDDISTDAWTATSSEQNYNYKYYVIEWTPESEITDSLSVSSNSCTVTASYDSNRVSVTAASSVLMSNSLSATIKAKSDWDQPTDAQVSVTMGGQALTSDTGYTYNTSTGALSISKVTGNVVITVAATTMPTWYTANDGANKTALQEALAATDASTLDATALDNLISGWTSIANTSGAQDAIASDLSTTSNTVTAADITKKLNDLNAASDFDTTYSALKDITSLDPASSDYETQKAAIEAAKTAYNSLTSDQQAYVPQAYKDLFQAYNWVEAAKSLYEKSPATKEDAAALQELVDDYSKMTDDSMGIAATVYENIINKNQGVDFLNDHDAIISDQGPIDASDLDDINAALDYYNNLYGASTIDPDGKIKADLEAKKAAAEWAKAYEDILSKNASDLTADDIAKLNEAKAAYDKLSDDAKAMVGSAALNDLLDKQSDLFIKTYVSNSAGNIYKEANASNYAQILSGKDTWDTLTQDEKDAINAKLVANGGKTYEELLAQAQAIQKQIDDEAAAKRAKKAAKTGDETQTALWMLLGFMAAAAAAVSLTRKRRVR